MAEHELLINDRKVVFTPGQTILEAAKTAGIEIPSLCYLKDAIPTGACRVCVVEVRGARTLQPACATPAALGMKVQTESPKVIQARRTVLELLISSGNHNCAVNNNGNRDWTRFQLNAHQNDGSEELCPAWGHCKLQDLAFRYQVKSGRFDLDATQYPSEMVNPLIIRDFSRCIL